MNVATVSLAYNNVKEVRALRQTTFPTTKEKPVSDDKDLL